MTAKKASELLFRNLKKSEYQAAKRLLQGKRINDQDLRRRIENLLAVHNTPLSALQQEVAGARQDIKQGFKATGEKVDAGFKATGERLDTQKQQLDTQKEQLNRIEGLIKGQTPAPPPADASNGQLAQHYQKEASVGFHKASEAKAQASFHKKSAATDVILRRQDKEEEEENKRKKQRPS